MDPEDETLGNGVINIEKSKNHVFQQMVWRFPKSGSKTCCPRFCRLLVSLPGTLLVQRVYRPSLAYE